MFNPTESPVDDKPRPFGIGRYWGMAVWNKGTSTIYASSGVNAAPVPFLDPGESIVLDNFEDQLWLSCATSQTSTVRIQTWGKPYFSILADLVGNLLRYFTKPEERGKR